MEASERESLTSRSETELVSARVSETNNARNTHSSLSTIFDRKKKKKRKKMDWSSKPYDTVENTKRREDSPLINSPRIDARDVKRLFNTIH